MTAGDIGHSGLGGHGHRLVKQALRAVGSHGFAIMGDLGGQARRA